MMIESDFPRDQSLAEVIPLYDPHQDRFFGDLQPHLLTRSTAIDIITEYWQHPATDLVRRFYPLRARYGREWRQFMIGLQQQGSRLLNQPEIEGYLSQHDPIVGTLTHLTELGLRVETKEDHSHLAKVAERLYDALEIRAGELGANQQERPWLIVNEHWAKVAVRFHDELAPYIA